MEDKLEEIYKLSGFKTDVAKELFKCSHKCIEAAYALEHDEVRKACKKARVTEAASDKTSDLFESFYSYVMDDLFIGCLDKKFDSASLLADKSVGDPDWKTYQKILDSVT